jgi:hypothetical protein
MLIACGEDLLWSMDEPLNNDFAQVEDVGNQQRPYFRSELTDEEPRKVRLFGELKKTGDFIWYRGGSFAIVRAGAADIIRSRFPCFDARPVEFATKKGTRNEALSRRLSQYSFVVEPERIALDWSLTSFEERADGTKSITGVESRVFRGVREDGTSVIDLVPRVPGLGMYVRESELQGNNFFMLRERPSFYCCTTAFKEFIEMQNFSNIEFREMGGIVRFN